MEDLEKLVDWDVELMMFIFFVSLLVMGLFFILDIVFIVEFFFFDDIWFELYLVCFDVFLSGLEVIFFWGGIVVDIVFF